MRDALPASSHVSSFPDVHLVPLATEILGHSYDGFASKGQHLNSRLIGSVVMRSIYSLTKSFSSPTSDTKKPTLVHNKPERPTFLPLLVLTPGWGIGNRRLCSRTNNLSIRPKPPQPSDQLPTPLASIIQMLVCYKSSAVCGIKELGPNPTDYWCKDPSHRQVGQWPRLSE